MLPDLDWVGFGFDLDLRPAANVVDGQIVKLDRYWETNAKEGTVNTERPGVHPHPMGDQASSSSAGWVSRAVVCTCKHEPMIYLPYMLYSVSHKLSHFLILFYSISSPAAIRDLSLLYFSTIY